MPDVTFNNLELLKLQAKIEKIGGVIAAFVRHYQRTGEQAFEDLMQEGTNDMANIRTLLTDKGVLVREIAVPKSAEPQVNVPLIISTALSSALDNGRAPPVDLDPPQSIEQPA